MSPLLARPLATGAVRPTGPGGTSAEVVGLGSCDALLPRCLRPRVLIYLRTQAPSAEGRGAIWSDRHLPRCEAGNPSRRDPSEHFST